MTIAVLLLTGGLVILFCGAEALVRASAALALRLGISPVIIGLTIVASGTSAPELVVSIGAGLQGRGDIALGNVIGSNIFNIAAILGLSGLVHPLKVHRQVVRLDIPIMIAVSAVFVFMLRDSAIAGMEGPFLLTGFVGYCILAIVLARKKSSGEESPSLSRQGSGGVVLNVAWIIAGLAALVLGSRLFVRGAVILADYAGISEALVGLTIVAAGTSLPELATSIVAALKKQDDIAIGNIVGSNIFNILAIVGISGTMIPLRARGIGMTDMAFMLATSALLLPFLLRTFRLNRIHSSVLLALYGGYMVLLWP